MSIWIMSTYTNMIVDLTLSFGQPNLFLILIHSADVNNCMVSGEVLYRDLETSYRGIILL